MIRGTMIYIGSPKAMKRGLGKIVKEAMQEAGALWHRRYLPEHFRQGAASKYGYQKRTSAYMKRKARYQGHQRPLEFKGDLKREATRMAHITGTSKRVTVNVSVPWYVNRAWKTRSSMPDLEKELTKATSGEERRLARVVEQLSTRKLDQVQTRETRA